MPKLTEKIEIIYDYGTIYSYLSLTLLSLSDK